jgi:hypothetical protein
MLITAGILLFLAGLIIVLAGSDVLVDGKPIGDGARTIAVVAVALGVADVLVGILILRLVSLARILGFGLAGLTVLIGLVSLVQGNARAILQLLLGGFTIWALIVAEPAFRRDPRR